MKKKIKKGWRFHGNENKYLKRILKSDFSAGLDNSMSEKFEHIFKKKHNQKFGISSNSGTATLHQALHAFGVGHGDEVIIPALTVAMCGFVVWQCGAVPVYADVDKETFLINPADIKKKITKKTKAIMVVHLYGLMCDMDEILKIAKEYKLKVLEDCAQCFLAYDHKNRISGTIGDVGSWSLESSKHISSGEGGILTTNNKSLAAKMRKFGGLGFSNITAYTGKIRDRNKFQNPNWKRHNEFGYNYRMPQLCAAVALAQTEKLEYFVKKRQESGNEFFKLLNRKASKLLVPQKVPKNYSHTYFTFAAVFNGRKKGIKWTVFRKKFMSFGGDGIYSAWQTVNNEPCFYDARKKGLYSGSMKISKSYGWGEAPVAKKLQKNMMQFTTNQQTSREIKKQILALEKTIDFFE